MCGIAGFYQSHFDYLTKEDHYRQILEEMERVQKHRGPDEQGSYLEPHFGLAHVRLSIRDLVSGRQPILKKWEVRPSGSCITENFIIRKNYRKISWKKAGDFPLPVIQK